MGGGALIGQIDVNREQRPHDAHLAGSSAPDSPDGPTTAPCDEPPVTPAMEPGHKAQGDGAPGDATQGDTAQDPAQEEAPPWTAPLREMYRQVVEEPLPDFLSDLLSRLDRDER